MYRTHVLTVSESFLGRLGHFLVSLRNNSPELSATFFWAVLDIQYYCINKDIFRDCSEHTFLGCLGFFGMFRKYFGRF